MPVCPKCGVEVREGKAFCFNCGWPVARPAAERGEARPEYRSTLSPPPESGGPAPPERATGDQTLAADDQRRGAHSISEPTAARGPSRRRFFYGKFGVWTVVALLLLVVLGVLALALIAG